jgi:hypothetical protein
VEARINGLEAVEPLPLAKADQLIARLNAELFKLLAKERCGRYASCEEAAKKIAAEKAIA